MLKYILLILCSAPTHRAGNREAAHLAKIVTDTMPKSDETIDDYMKVCLFLLPQSVVAKITELESNQSDKTKEKKKSKKTAEVGSTDKSSMHQLNQIALDHVIRCMKVVPGNRLRALRQNDGLTFGLLCMIQKGFPVPKEFITETHKRHKFSLPQFQQEFSKTLAQYITDLYDNFKENKILPSVLPRTFADEDLNMMALAISTISTQWNLMKFVIGENLDVIGNYDAVIAPTDAKIAEWNSEFQKRFFAMVQQRQGELQVEFAEKLSKRERKKFRDAGAVMVTPERLKAAEIAMDALISEEAEDARKRQSIVAKKEHQKARESKDSSEDDEESSDETPRKKAHEPAEEVQEKEIDHFDLGGEWFLIERKMRVSATEEDVIRRIRRMPFQPAKPGDHAFIRAVERVFPAMKQLCLDKEKFDFLFPTNIHTNKAINTVNNFFQTILETGEWAPQRYRPAFTPQGEFLCWKPQENVYRINWSVFNLIILVDESNIVFKTVF